MSKMKVSVAQVAVDRLASSAAADVQRLLTADVQATIQQVRDEMDGEDAGKVYIELVARILSRQPALQINEQDLRRVATQISSGTPRD